MVRSTTTVNFQIRVRVDFYIIRIQGIHNLFDKYNTFDLIRYLFIVYIFLVNITILYNLVLKFYEKKL